MTETTVAAGNSSPHAVPLIDGFRYVHEPWSDGGPIPFLGSDREVTALADRIVHSSGGTILVTGFRGVGKSTVVGEALRALDAGAGPRVLPIVTTVARPIAARDLLFELIRRLFERARDEGLLDRMDSRASQALLLAYLRTSVFLNETRTSSTQATAGIKLDLDSLSKAAAGLIGLPVPSLDLSRASTREMGTHASFLAYSDTDIEHDFIRVVQLMAEKGNTKRSRAARLKGIFSRQRDDGTWPRRLVVVLEELDKFTAQPGGPEALVNLIARLKNVLTMPGIHFVLVAGVDLHDAVVRDVQRGNSVYASIISSQIYVPCRWDSARQLLAGVIPGQPDALQSGQEGLRLYLDFRARGIPRLLLREMNDLVAWQDGQAVLRLDETDRARVDLYSHVEQITRNTADTDPHAVLATRLEADRRTLAKYYLIDWCLRWRGDKFSLDEFVAAADSAIDPAIKLTVRNAVTLLGEMVRRSFVETCTDGTVLGDSPPRVLYRLSRDVARRLNEVLGPDGDQDLGERPTPAGSPAAGAALRERYRLDEVIARGGMGVVWRGLDLVSGRPVAVKVLTRPGGSTSDRERFLREGNIGVGLHHPNVVETYDVFEDEPGQVRIVMQLVAGATIASEVEEGAVDPVRAVGIAMQLCGAVEYLHSRGLVRLDLKPSNVILDPGGRPVIVDLGIAKPRSEGLEVTGTVYLPIGTPRYMAPEQFKAGEVSDARSDIYALGLILFEMLAGHPARTGDDYVDVIRLALVEGVSTESLPVSTGLRKAIARAVAFEPTQRYQTAVQLSRALQRTPEGRQSIGRGIEPSLPTQASRA